jgi:ABC-type Fe3+/spermidine/putrescine transport system ATPase subunit
LTPALRLESIRKAYDGFSLDISLELGEGEILSILGPSGSGKSTTLRIIAGLERQDSGSICVRGEEVGDREAGTRGVGMVFQDFALFPHLSLKANVEYGLRSGAARRAGIGAAERDARVALMLKTFALERLAKRSVEGLSGGEKQRVALARSLAVRPAIALLDEPLGSLDAALRKSLRGQIAKGLRDAGQSSVIVTHDQEDALAVSDQILIMRDGLAMERGRPEELYHEPKTEFTARFLGAAAVLPAEFSRVGGAWAARCECGEFAMDRRWDERVEKMRGAEAGLVFRLGSCRVGTPGSGERGVASLPAVVVHSEFSGGAHAVSARLRSGLCVLASSPLRLQGGQETRIDFDLAAGVPVLLDRGPGDRG